MYDEFFSVYREAPWSAVILLVFSNTFLFLQDWVMFAAVVDGRLVPSGNFMKPHDKPDAKRAGFTSGAV